MNSERRHAQNLELLSGVNNKAALWLYSRIVEIIEEDQLDQIYAFGNCIHLRFVRDMVFEKIKQEGEKSNVAKWPISGYCFDLALSTFPSHQSTRVSFGIMPKTDNGQVMENESRIHTYDPSTIADILQSCNTMTKRPIRWEAQSIKFERNKLKKKKVSASMSGRLYFALIEDESLLDWKVVGTDRRDDRTFTRTIRILSANMVHYLEHKIRRYKLTLRTDRYQITIEG